MPKMDSKVRITHTCRTCSRSHIQETRCTSHRAESVARTPFDWPVCCGVEMAHVATTIFWPAAKEFGVAT